jgi:hypothetical protein
LKVSSDVVWAGVARAARDPFKVTILGLSSLGSALTGSWILLGMSAAGYLVAMMVDLRSREFWSGVLAQLRRRPPAIPDVESVVDAESRMVLYRLKEAARELEDVAPPPGQERIAFQERVVTLERRAVGLLEDLHRLERYLGDHPLACAERDLNLCESQLAATTDPGVADERRWHRTVVRKKVSGIRQAEADRRRVGAELHATVATLDALCCQLARPVVGATVVEDEARRLLLGDLEEPAELEITESERSRSGGL